MNHEIVQLLKEGVAIRGIARFLNISVTTVIARIKSIAKNLTKENQRNHKGVYEIDELWTYVGKKTNDVWISYAINRLTKEVVSFVVGPRTKARLSCATSATLALKPAKVCTDGLHTYRTLVPPGIHHIGLPHTRHIERFNLTLRTHLKRLTRKTICFSKNLVMLESCLKIYFWS